MADLFQTRIGDGGVALFEIVHQILSVCNCLVCKMNKKISDNNNYSPMRLHLQGLVYKCFSYVQQPISSLIFVLQTEFSMLIIFKKIYRL